MGASTLGRHMNHAYELRTRWTRARVVLRCMLIPLLSIGAVSQACAYPGYLDGITLKTELESSIRIRANRAMPGDIDRAAHAYGYISGVVDAFNNDTTGHFFCVPPSVTKEQLADVVLEHIKMRPTLWAVTEKSNATFVLFDALGLRFPCKKP
jgi:Rap1a immunity proteins